MATPPRDASQPPQWDDRSIVILGVIGGRALASNLPRADAEPAIAGFDRVLSPAPPIEEPQP
jgi:hypothetical protein